MLTISPINITCNNLCVEPLYSGGGANAASATVPSVGSGVADNPNVSVGAATTARLTHRPTNLLQRLLRKGNPMRGAEPPQAVIGLGYMSSADRTAMGQGATTLFYLN